MTVLDNDETYAMDEFYFSFFGRTREAFTKLQTCLDAKRHQEKEKIACSTLEHRGGLVGKNVFGESTKFLDRVKDTTTLIRSSSPTQEYLETGGSSRRSAESLRPHDIMDDAEFLGSSGHSSPKRHSFRLPRASIRHFGLGSLNKRSPSPSPLRTSFESIDRPSGGSSTPGQEPSWTDTGKMLWSKGVNAADWIQQRSSKVSSQVGTMLASPGTTLNAGVGKVSQLWNGDYSKSRQAKWVSEETAKDMKDQNPEERFQTHFALPKTEKLVGSYYGYVFRTFPFYGKMYLSKRHFCFRSLLPGIKTKVLDLTSPRGNIRWCCLYGILKLRKRRRLITGRISA